MPENQPEESEVQGKGRTETSKSVKKANGIDRKAFSAAVAQFVARARAARGTTVTPSSQLSQPQKSGQPQKDKNNRPGM